MTETYDDQYRSLLRAILESDVEVNVRTGVRVRTLAGGASLKIQLQRAGGIPEPGNRRYFPHVAAAELAWMVQGTRDAGFIMRHAPRMWGKFLDSEILEPSNMALTAEDWRVDNAGPTIGTAYGWRWRRAFGRDQLAQAIDALDADPSNRQVYVSAWDPRRDGLGGPQPKNIPCPVGFSLCVTGGKVHCSVFLRSSDAYVGLPYDVMVYALLTDCVAASLRRAPGSLHVTMANVHLYEPHWDMAATDVWNLLTYPVAMPGWSVGEVEARPDSYVDSMKMTDRPKHPVHRLPELIA